MSRLDTSLCGISLKTPVLAASGTYGYGIEFSDLTDLAAIGAIVVKGLSREPMEGNPPPRVQETMAGMLNSIGLQNIGVRAFLREKLPGLRERGATVFANIFGYAVEDYVEVARALNEAEGIAAYELNVSCPNTREGGIYFSSDPRLLADVVSAFVRVAQRPVMVKLSPNVARIEPLARAAEDAGAHAISLINTMVGLAVDARTRRPRLGANFGGLSGPGIKAVALRMVYECAQAVKIPVVGLGGITNGEDAAEFMIAGASAVQVGTANFWDPAAPVRVARELEGFLEREGIAHASDLTGTLKLNPRS